MSGCVSCLQGAKAGSPGEGKRKAGSRHLILECRVRAEGLGMLERRPRGPESQQEGSW